MVLVELASVEEAIDAVANLAMLSQMKSEGSEPLKVKVVPDKGSGSSVGRGATAARDAQLQGPTPGGSY